MTTEEVIWKDGGEVEMDAGFDRDGNPHAGIISHDRGILAPFPATREERLTTEELEELRYALDTAQNEWGGDPEFPDLRDKLRRIIEWRKSVRTVAYEGDEKGGYYATVSGPVNRFPPIEE